MERGLLEGFFPKSFLKIDLLLLPESKRLLTEGVLFTCFPLSLRPLLGLAGRSLCTGVVSTDCEACGVGVGVLLSEIVCVCVCVCAMCVYGVNQGG